MKTALLVLALLLGGCNAGYRIVEVRIILEHNFDSAHPWSSPQDFTTVECTDSHERIILQGIGYGKVGDVFKTRVPVL